MQSEDLQATLNDVAKVAEFLWQKGWAERNSGNLSVRVTGMADAGFQLPLVADSPFLPEPFGRLAGEVFLVTARGSRMRNVSENQQGTILLIRITAEGDRYEILHSGQGGARIPEPTSELVSHLMIHQFLVDHKPQSRAVLHTHPVNLIALSHSTVYKEEAVLNRTLWGMMPETLILVPKGLGVVPYRVTGSIELAQASIRALRDHDVLLWEKHGCLATASTVVEAFDLIDVLEKSAHILLTCLHAGFLPEGLTDDQLDELRQRCGYS